MHKARERAKKILGRIMGLLPAHLPVGRTDFDRFCDRLFWVYDLPTFDSYRESVATMIMHLAPTLHKVPPSYFARSIQKAMANQVAYSVIQELKKKQKELETKEKEVVKEAE